MKIKNRVFDKMQFHFVGDGKLSNILIDLSKKFHHCHFHGFQSDMVPFYHDADVVIAPSRWEGLPYSILEAQSCGVPVITTDTPGCRDIVKDKITGWICEVDNVKNITALLISAFKLWQENFEEYAIIGSNARKNIVEHYQENVINSKIEKFIFL